MLFVFLLIFLLGLFVGSFLNVVLLRYSKGETIIFKPSYCPSCKHKLTPIELIPVFSFFIQRGKCRNCGRPISWQYPLVETLTGLLFFLSFWFWRQTQSFQINDFATLPYLLTISSILLLIFFFDAKYGIIPDPFIFIGSIITLLYRLIVFLTIGIGPSTFGETIIIPIFTGFFIALFFWSIIILTRGRGMGFGDVKLGFLLGLILPYPKIFLILFLAFVLGAIYSLILVSFGKKSFKDTIPFGPFLVLAAYAALFFGEEILSLYLSLI